MKDQQLFINLMREMLLSNNDGNNVFKSSSYWSQYSNDMVKALEENGIDNFRSIPDKSLLAFATGSMFKQLKPKNSKFWKFHKVLSSAPLLSSFLNRYEKEINEAWSNAYNQANYKLRLMVDNLKKNSPDLLEIQDPLIGNPIVFDIDGKKYSEEFLYKIFELSGLRKKIDFSKINNIIEVGCSYGLLGSIILSLHKSINYTFVDISPVPAITSYYLSNLFPSRVQLFPRKNEYSEFNTLNSGRTNIKIICAHDLPLIKEKYDLFINTSSFQEMDINQVEYYCNFIKNNINKCYLNNNKKSKYNKIDTERYISMLDPMKVDHIWDDIIYSSYQPIILSK